MASAEALETLTQSLPKLYRMKSIIRFDTGDEGFTVDARTDKPVLVDDGSLTPDCTIKVTPENMVKLINGEMDPMLGYTLGRIRVQGSMDVAMKLVKAIS